MFKREERQTVEHGIYDPLLGLQECRGSSSKSSWVELNRLVRRSNANKPKRMQCSAVQYTHTIRTNSTHFLQLEGKFMTENRVGFNMLLAVSLAGRFTGLLTLTDIAAAVIVIVETFNSILLSSNFSVWNSFLTNKQKYRNSENFLH